MQSVQLSVGDWWGLTAAFRDDAFRAEVVVDGSVVGSLKSEWTMQAFDSFKGINRTRQTIIRFTSHAEWTIQTEIPPNLPVRKKAGFKTRTLRDLQDRRVTLSHSEESNPLATYQLKGPRDRPYGTIEDRSHGRFIVETTRSQWSIGSVTTDGGQRSIRRNTELVEIP